MADGKIVIATDLDTAGIKSGLGTLEGAIKGKTNVISGAIKGVGAVASAVVGYSITVGSSFEASMSQVAATMGMTTEEIHNGSDSFKMLEKAAKDAGATTQFSASESAEALNYLALAGYDSEKACKALPDVLNLAAAGGLDLAYASDLATDAMSSLGLSTDNLTQFTDQLAKTAQKSNTSVGQLGEAILTVGGTAKVLAGGTTELNTALGILADNGIKGAEGGTALRNIILSLTAPTDKAAKKLKDLGVNALDAKGNVRPLNETFKDLNKKLSTMSDGKKTEVLNEIFNKVDLKSVNALLANSGERFDELSGYIANADGAAANMAETMNDNLKGKLKILESSLEGFGIEIYQSMEEPLKFVADSAVSSIGRISKAFTEGGLIGALKELGNIIVESIGSAIQYLVENVPEFLNKGMELANSLLNGFLEKSSEFPSVLGESMTSVIEGIKENYPKFMTTGAELIDNIVSGLMEAIPSLIENFGTGLQNCADAITELLPMFLETGSNIVLNVIDGLTTGIENLAPTAQGLIQTVIDIITENLPKLIDKGIEVVTNFVNGIYEKLPDLWQSALDMMSGIFDTIMENLPDIISAGVSILLSLIKGIADNLPKLAMTAIKLIGQLLSTIASKLPDILSMGLKLLVSLVNGLWDNRDKLFEAGKSLIKMLPSVMSEALSCLLDVGKNIVIGIWNGISNSMDWICDKISGWVDSVIDWIKECLGIASPSRVMRDEVGKWMAQGIGVGFERESTTVAKSMQKELEDMVGAMQYTVALEQSKVNRSASLGRYGYSSNTTTNNNGVTQNITFNNPVKSPYETYKAVRKAGRDLAFG